MMMRKISFSLLVACIGLFAACKDKKDDPVIDKTDYAAKVAAIYHGKLEITLPGQTEPTTTVDKITITRTADNKVKLELNNFTFTAVGNVGNIVVNNVVVSKKADKYLLHETTEKLKLMDGKLEATATAMGDVVGKNLELHIDVLTAIFENKPIKVVFKGNTDIPVEDHAKAVEANYTGEIVVTLPGQTDGVTSTNSIALTRTELNKVKLELNDFIFNKENVGNIVINNIPVAKVNTKYVLAETTEKIKLMAGQLDATVTVKGDVEGANLILSLNILTAATGVAPIKVSFKGKKDKNNSQFFDMENWVLEQGTEADQELYVPSGGWGSTNKATYMIDFYVDGALSVTKSASAHAGTAAAEIKTLDSQGDPNYFGAVIPKITAGSLFTGHFDLAAAIGGNSLKATKFGIAFDKKPVTISAYYKYTPGKDFYRSSGIAKESHTAVIDSKTTDQCVIRAVLYETTNNTDHLTGVDIDNSTRIIATAELKDGTAKSSYTHFTADFVYTKNYDKTKSYRLAIIASSSKEGNKFSGAPGSSLLLDDVEIITEL